MFRPLCVSFSLLSLLTGLIYPAAITGLAQLCFPEQAGGSLVRVDGQVRGSRLIGQHTDDPHFFWGRPSATAPFPTNAAASAGSTLAPSNPALAERIRKRIQVLQDSNPDLPIPQDLVTSSASGLDPHISPEAARWQIPRIARLRGLEPTALESLIQRHTEPRSLGMLGEPRVTVLLLNRELEQTERR